MKKENLPVSWKKIFISADTNFNTFIPGTYKTGLIKSLLFWCLKSILYESSYPHDCVGKCKKEVLGRVLTTKIVASTMPKKDLMRVPLIAS